MDVLITMRVRDARPENVVPGSAMRRCPRCGAKCWVSPSCWPLLDEQGFVLTCRPCLAPDERLAEARGPLVVPPGQRRELAAFFAGMN